MFQVFRQISQFRRPFIQYSFSQSFNFDRLVNALKLIEEEKSTLKKQVLLTKLLTEENSSQTKRQILNFLLCRLDQYKAYEKEVGIPEQTIQYAVSTFFKVPIELVIEKQNQLGGLSECAQHLWESQIHDNFVSTPLSVYFQEFQEIYLLEGTGSQDLKEKKIHQLFSYCQSSWEIKFLIRFLVKTMRIGLGERNIEKVLFQLQETNSEYRNIAKEALGYNIEHNIELGFPFLVTLARSYSSVTQAYEEFSKSLECFCEPKYDGLRCQVHYLGGEKIELFSRTNELMSNTYPNLREKLINQFKSINLENGIFDCEMVCFDEQGQVLAFQDIQQQRSTTTADITLICFDVLYYNNRNLLKEPLKERQKYYKQFPPLDSGSRSSIQYINSTELDKNHTSLQIQELFDKQKRENLEGIIIKLNTEYKPGKRSEWAKVKDSRDFDLALIGGEWGLGRRKNMLGAFLLGCYDQQTQMIHPLTKVGTGFSEVLLKQITEEVQISPSQPEQVYCLKPLKPSVWIKPLQVWEVKFDCVTHSPIYEIASEKQKFKGGLSLRFPRFIRNRTDKKILDCTTTEDVVRLYLEQNKMKRYQ